MSAAALSAALSAARSLFFLSSVTPFSPPLTLSSSLTQTFQSHSLPGSLYLSCLLSNLC